MNLSQTFELESGSTRSNQPYICNCACASREVSCSSPLPPRRLSDLRRRLHRRRLSPHLKPFAAQPLCHRLRSSEIPSRSPAFANRNSGALLWNLQHLVVALEQIKIQTMAGYQSNTYNNQNNMWNDGSFGSYNVQHYPSYSASCASSSQSSSSIPGNNSHLQYQYNQWPTYYNHPTSSVSAPATEHLSTNPPVHSVAGGYPYASSQPPPPGTTSWGRGSSASGFPTIQGTAEVAGQNLSSVWEARPPGLQMQQITQVSSYLQKPLETNPVSDNSEDQQKNIVTQGSNLQLSSTNKVSEKFQPPLQTVAMMDTHRVAKIQIPTNPRITSSLPLATPKAEKEIPMNNATLKPAYINVSVSKLNNKIPSHDDSEAIFKMETFPPSLRAYVERTFARCKDDAQRAANKNLLKEMITKSSTDGTLFTRNWDIEPLFPLHIAISDKADQNNMLNSGTVSLSIRKRSPTRRHKSRWEPLPEEKLAEKLTPASNEPAKGANWNQISETETVADTRKHEPKDDGWGRGKFFASRQQNSLNKVVQRPVKKPRFSDTVLTENADGSSDSDKEQGLTKYYSGAMALANSPEERKKREHRSKRFEKGQNHSVEYKPYSPKVAGAGNFHSRRASSLMPAKNNDSSSSKSVEDIDRHALTVRGTCQEIEKCYLRLTSAPDPATVRPEDVLEKALQMVQASEKNYLYKCDQLKSIRQDLTVQRIRNELTVKVYETHARLALEAEDLPEYNQCQSQLKNLYAEGIKGNHMEFSAYHLLCMILHSNNKGDLLSSMARLSAEAKENEAVKHALAVRRAVLSGNYILFFRLYGRAPNLNACFMDLHVEKMRFEAIRCMSKSYRPRVPVAYISQVLGFSRLTPTEESAELVDGLVECEDWLKAHGAVLTVDDSGELQMDTKITSSSLYMPEPDGAVPHGDANLAVNDFLTRTS
ncbi:hypothetical protein J5N97_019145 [Dioscorea zingiberensis]|uniref:PCI domain-containing protein n=1 Tax=Dioscorea zingiberensis TaxID=325984 RepID=A0A9D5CDI1_9LILI|nr:hypothetical protein J5N97_019145 [Dioscorea zingiberensis]